jgi:ubiquinone/menaquinone biosynthesis C-methylase UbiE
MAETSENMVEVFALEKLQSLGLEYKTGMVRTANKRGYMRNFLCPASQNFCSQKFGPTDRVLEIGSGIGAVLKTLIDQGAKQIWAVDMEAQHLEYSRELLAQTLAEHPDVSLTTLADRLPELAQLKTGSFRSILCAQILQYLKPEEFTQALTRLHGLLLPGGTLYITVGTPYLQVYRGFAEEYARRVQNGDRFPGYMDPRQYHPQGANHNPGFFLFFDPPVLSARVAEAGFRVERAFFMDGSGQERGQTALIAVKE